MQQMSSSRLSNLGSLFSDLANSDRQGAQKLLDALGKRIGPNGGTH